MALAAADALARAGREGGLREEHLLPPMDDVEAHVQVALATALAAQREGLAGLALSPGEIEEGARRRILDARETAALLLREGRIAPPPDAG
jgi:malic enzyme